MTELNPNASRRDFLKTTGQVATASALAGVAVPMVHAAEDNTIQVALVGCGGRGTGAAENALSTKQGPIKLVAMADVFKDRLDDSYENLKKESRRQGRSRLSDHKFIGFDGYQKAMDSLKRATSSSSPRRRPSAGFTSATRSRRASIPSWRSRSRSMGRRPAGCSHSARRRRRRTSRSALA